MIGAETSDSLQRFFATAFMPTSVNATALVLILKKLGASKITEFRPISCCTTLYKLTMRLLVSRMKKIILDLIEPNQTAFVKDRLLMENVLASEVMQGYHNQGGTKRITLKIDLAKAFNTLRWDSLLLILKVISKGRRLFVKEILYPLHSSSLQ